MKKCDLGYPVHLLGGTTALVGSWMLKPRLNGDIDPSSLVNSAFGLFLLVWGWLGFNCGSSFGVNGDKWILVARTASATLNAAMGGNLGGLMYCITIRKKYEVFTLVNTIIAALVAITPAAPLLQTGPVS